MEPFLDLPLRQDLMASSPIPYSNSVPSL